MSDEREVASVSVSGYAGNLGIDIISPIDFSHGMGYTEYMDAVERILDKRYRDLVAAIMIQAISDYCKGENDDVLIFLAGDWADWLVPHLGGGLDQVQERQVWKWIRGTCISGVFEHKGWLSTARGRQLTHYDTVGGDVA